MAKKKKNNEMAQEDLDVIEEDELEEILDSEELDQEEVIDLASEVENLKDELAVERNKFLTAHADLENTKKRLTNDFSKRSKYMVQEFALSLLPALDNMEKVLSETDDKDNPLLEAVEMMYRQLKSSLKSEGVEEIEALGEKFDSNFHHAIAVEEIDGTEADIVVEVLQKGYKIKDRVLRASMVKISQ